MGCGCAQNRAAVQREREAAASEGREATVTMKGKGEILPGSIWKSPRTRAAEAREQQAS